MGHLVVPNISVHTIYYTSIFDLVVIIAIIKFAMIVSYITTMFGKHNRGYCIYNIS